MSKLLDIKAQRRESLNLAEAITNKAEHEGRQLTTAEKATFDGHMARVQTLNAELGQRESRNTLTHNPHLDRFMAGLPPIGQPPSVGLPKGRTSVREAMQFATPDQREEVENFARYIGGNISALADLTPSGDASVTIPTLIAALITRNYAAFAPVVSVARLWPTVTGEPEHFPVVSDSENAVILAPAALTGADATVSGDTPPTALTGPLMGAYKFSSKPVFVPRETQTDSAINLIDEILGALFARVIRFQNLKYTKGAGTTELTGFLHDATAYTVTAATPIDLDMALDLAYSVPALYRPNGVYMASDLTIKYLRKLKTGISGDKRNLWHEFQDGNAADGTPATLHSFPIIVNNDMDSVAADGTFTGVNPLAFGDFSRFVVRQAEQGRPYVYRYTVPAKDGGAVIAFQRSDSKLLVSTAISKLSY